MEAYRGHRYGDAADELGAFVRSPSAPGALVPSGIHHLGRSYRSMGNLAASARHFDDLLRRFPAYRDRAQAMLEAAQVHIRLGNYARATALLSELEGRAGWAERARRERARMDQRRGVTESRGPDRAIDFADDAPTADESGD